MNGLLCYIGLIFSDLKSYLLLFKYGKHFLSLLQDCRVFNSLKIIYSYVVFSKSVRTKRTKIKN